MPASLDFAFQRSQLCPHPFRVGHPLELEPPRLPGLPTNMGEAQEAKRLRLAEPACCSSLGGEPSELDQSRLLGVQLQVELRESLAEFRPEPLGVVPMLESHHGIVSETHDDHVAVRVPLSPLVSP